MGMYGILFVAGMAASWLLMRFYVAFRVKGVSQDVDRVMLGISIGIIFGGRLGSILFYEIIIDLQHIDIFGPFEGMSFHGGLLGAAVAIYIYSRKTGTEFLVWADIASAAAPAGIFFGRVGNFLNDEIYGPVTNLPWGVVVRPGMQPRHPTQIYEAVLEGLFLFALLYALLWSRKMKKYPGMIAGIFLIGYSVARIPLEMLREDSWIAWLPMSIGQILCIPMICVGVILIGRSVIKACA